VLYDLPCIIETHRTFDRRQFYKVQDVSQVRASPGGRCTNRLAWPNGLPGEAGRRVRVRGGRRQMLVVGGEDPRNKPVPEGGSRAALYQWPHGVSRPLKNVRKRRFRKRLVRVRG